jgi:FxsC-like protein
VEEIGFIDRQSLRVGDDWPERVRSALNASRTMVVLQSRDYLNSDFCGKELEVFRRRRERYLENPAPDSDTPPLALPVLWDWPAQMPKLPEILAPVQFTNAIFGENYEGLGLRTLASQTRYADDYQQFVAMFAEYVVAAARPAALPAVDIGDVREIESAFRLPRPKPAPANAQAGAVTRYDRWSAWFIYVVGTADELRDVRANVSAYADDASAWRPFDPDEALPLKVLAARASAAENLNPERITLDADLAKELEEAQDGQSFVLLVVDPWSARLPRYSDCLDKFDRTKTINSEVLVAASAGDQETAAARDALDGDLRAVFWRSFALSSSPLRDSITSADTFEREVIAAINEIRKRLMQVGKLRQVPTAEPAGSLPLPTGPGAA